MVHDDAVLEKATAGPRIDNRKINTNNKAN